MRDAHNQLKKLYEQKKLEESYDAELKRLRENAIRLAEFNKEKERQNRIKRLKRNSDG